VDSLKSSVYDAGSDGISFNPMKNYPLLLCGQFFGALGDNALLAVILGQLTFLNLDGIMRDETLRFYNALFTTMLFIPYVVFAPWVGYLNDRFPKTTLLRAGNCFKILGTLICLLCLNHPTFLQGIGYFIVGTGSCMYSPAKYGILPEIVHREKLVKANGMVEMLTMVAILSGVIGGSVLVDRLPALLCYWVLIGGYLISLGLALAMSRTSGTPGLRSADSLKAFFSHAAYLLRGRRLRNILIGTTLFWFVGSAVKMNFQPWGLQILGFTDNTQISLLGLWLSIGLIIGNAVSGYFYRTGDLRHIRRYGFALGAGVLLLGVITAYGLVVAFLILTGAVGGLFLIPQNAAFQAETPPEKLGKTVAVQNFVENIAMCISGGFLAAVVYFNCPVQAVFILLALVIGGTTLSLNFKKESS
jgi:LPLT family lysophospholipid transporter-like MFS transporter